MNDRLIARTYRSAIHALRATNPTAYTFFHAAYLYARSSSVAAGNSLSGPPEAVSVKSPGLAATEAVCAASVRPGRRVRQSAPSSTRNQ